MNKFALVIIIVLGICSNHLFAQKHSKDFKISLPEYKIEKSRYNTIDFIDSRKDTTTMGIVQLGAFNKKARVITEIPLSTQLDSVILSLTDSTANNGELLFQLRKFKFVEVTGSFSEKGYCHLKAELYSKKNYQYHKLASIDTLILVKAMDVTKRLLKNTSKTITDFIADNLLKESIDPNCYTYNDVQKIDSIEKSRNKLYNTDTYAEGLYYNYKSFSRQEPDEQISVKMRKDGTISRVKILNTEKNKKVKPKNIYAIVYKGKPYITTKYGYYPLQKAGDDYMFIGKVEVSTDPTTVAVASMFFGVMGALMVSNPNATYVVMLDHTNGGFIYLRKIIIPQTE